MFKKILLPVDGSSTSNQAIEKTIAGQKASRGYAEVRRKKSRCCGRLLGLDVGRLGKLGVTYQIGLDEFGEVGTIAHKGLNARA